MIEKSRLEARLARLSGSIEWPNPSPHLPARVVARIEAKPAPVSKQRWRRPAIAATAVLMVTLFVVSPTARQAAADLLGEAGIRIGITVDPTPTTGANLELGEPASVSEVRDDVDFDIRIPAGDDPGPPAAAYMTEGGQISMVWAGSPALPAAGDTGVGLLFTQAKGGGGPDVGVKALGPRTGVQNVVVEGRPALWIEGADHTLTLLDTDGNPIEATTRLAANVLLWELDGVNLRLETTGDLQRALDIVESLGSLP